MSGTHYRITPISVGTLTNDHAQLVWGQQFGTKVQIQVLMFYGEGGGRRIMVDTGCSDPEAASKYHYPFVRTPEQEPLRAIEAAGVDPGEVDTVVATHLHWDHCGNNALFPNARFLVQRKELQFAAAPLPIFANAYEAPTTGMTPAYSGTEPSTPPVAVYCWTFGTAVASASRAAVAPAPAKVMVAAGATGRAARPVRTR